MLFLLVTALAIAIFLPFGRTVDVLFAVLWVLMGAWALVQGYELGSRHMGPGDGPQSRE
jgi:hypothetical protein